MIEPGKIKVLIVDDEPLARRKIRGLLKNDPEIEVVGECSNGNDAIASVKALSPDLLFLDIQIPELDGIKVSEALVGKDTPQVIFVTAYDQYAVRAFELQALDFLLKPYDRERFEAALRRAKIRIQEKQTHTLGPQILALLNQLREKPKYLEKLVIKESNRVFFINTSDIDWIEAQGNYVRLHIGKESYLQRENLGNLLGQLGPSKFRRIHRSTIVNIDRIQEIRSWMYGDYHVILKDGTQLTLSRSYRDELNELLGRS
ncbi:MAG TPA: LytTR family DNA-binding domain-containing protein [Blastocatellia bacterium]|nr:LytTR family DNA-binding domain-containing protein [Blastocatellia bacterium]